MHCPVSVLSRGEPLRPWADASIRQHADELARRHPTLGGCDVVVSAPTSRWRRAAGPWDVLLRLERPNAPPLLVHPIARERVDLAIDEAFALAHVLLEEAAERPAEVPVGAMG